MIPKDISSIQRYQSVVVPSCKPRSWESEPNVSKVLSHLELHTRASQRSTRRKKKKERRRNEILVEGEEKNVLGESHELDRYYPLWSKHIKAKTQLKHFASRKSNTHLWSWHLGSWSKKYMSLWNQSSLKLRPSLKEGRGEGGGKERESVCVCLF